MSSSDKDVEISNLKQNLEIAKKTAEKNSSNKEKELKSKINSLETEITDLKKLNKNLDELNKKQGSELSQQSKEIRELKQSSEKKNNLFAQLENSKLLLSDTMKTLKQQSEADMRKLGDKIASLQSTIQQKSSELSEKDIKIGELQTSTESLNNNIKNLQVTIQGLKNEKTELTTKNAAQAAYIADRTKEIEKLQQEIAGINSEMSRQKEENKSKVQQFEAKIDELKKNLSQTQTALQSKKDKLAKALEGLKKMGDKTKEYKKEYSALRQNIYKSKADWEQMEVTYSKEQFRAKFNTIISTFIASYKAIVVDKVEILENKLKTLIKNFGNLKKLTDNKRDVLKNNCPIQVKAITDFMQQQMQMFEKKFEEMQQKSQRLQASLGTVEDGVRRKKEKIFFLQETVDQMREDNSMMQQPVILSFGSAAK